PDHRHAGITFLVSRRRREVPEPLAAPPMDLNARKPPHPPPSFPHTAGSAPAAPPAWVSPTLHRGRTGKMGVATGTRQWISAAGRDDAAGERRTHTAPSPPDAAQRRS